MSSSPLPSDRHKPTRPPLSPPPSQRRPERLSLSQSLIITAGLAGMIGLGSGAVIRFSLATSSNTRFLNPLQTFPALPNWTSELPQGTADSHYLPSGAEPNRTGEVDRPPSSVDETASSDSRSIPAAAAVDSPDGTFPNQSSAAFDTSSFDAFAARDKRINSPADPRETLEKGPSIGTSSPYLRDLPYPRDLIDSIEKSPDPANLDENLNEGYSDKTTESDGYSPDYSAPDYSGADYPGAEPDYSDDAGDDSYENNGQW